MKKQVHENYIKSSNLIFVSSALGLISFYFSGHLFLNSLNITIAVFTVVFTVGIGLLVRRGYHWIKIFLLIITLLGLIGIPLTLKNLTEKPIVGIINVIQTILQIWSVVLLFQIPKNFENKPI